jgi:hypothetical protein
MTLGKTTAGGWDGRHKQQRRRWQAMLNQGAVIQCACTRPDCTHQGQCPVLIDSATRWDLGHDDHDRTRYNGPECVPCNRSAGARNMVAAHYGRRIANGYSTADRW